MNMFGENEEGNRPSTLKKDRRNSAIDENIGFGKRRSFDRVKHNELFYGLQEEMAEQRKAELSVEDGPVADKNDLDET